MSKPKKDWGEGIPAYTEQDLLCGEELEQFCANIVAHSMEEDGYEIEGIVKEAPAQVIAQKNGRTYAAIVATAVFPMDGRISYGMKKRFASFCRKQKVSPMCASVSLMSSDRQRALAGLTLKHDEFHVSFSGVEKLARITLPEPTQANYRAYCTEQLVESYCAVRFAALEPFLAEGVEFRSEWVNEPLNGKTAVMEYFGGMAKSIKKAKTTIQGSVVKITGKKEGKTTEVPVEPDMLCGLLAQELNGETNWMLIIPVFDGADRIVKMYLTDPGAFEMQEYYTLE